MKRRVNKLRPGDRVIVNDIAVTLDEVHNFPALPVGNGAHTPACTLLIYGDQSISLEQHERLQLCQR